MSLNNAEKKRYYEPAPQDINVENFKKVVTSRRSVRKFTDKAIPAEVLDDCLDLALLAPNSSNYSRGHFMWCNRQRKKSNWSKPV